MEKKRDPVATPSTYLFMRTIYKRFLQDFIWQIAKIILKDFRGSLLLLHKFLD